VDIRLSMEMVVRKTRLNTVWNGGQGRPGWLFPRLFGCALLVAASQAAAPYALAAAESGAGDVRVAQLGGAASEPGRAPEPNDAGAVAIRQAVERWLLDFFPPDSPGGQAVILQGQVIVEPFGERYAVTLPDITLNLGSGMVMPIGTITLSLTPQTPVTYRVAMRLPLPFPILDDTGTEIGRFDMAGQRVRGVWDTRFETLTGLDAVFSDIVVQSSLVDGDPVALFTMGELDIQSTLDVDDYLHLTGPSKLTAARIEIKDEDGNRLTYIENLVSETEVRSFDMVNMNRFARRFQSLAQAFIPSPEGELPDRETTDLLLDQLRRELLDLPSLMSDAGGAVTINGLVVNDPVTSRGYSVDEIVYSILVRGMNEETSRINAQYGHTGLVSLPAPPAPDLTPDEISFELDVEGIPNSQLWDIITQIPNDMSLYGALPGANFGLEKLFHVLAVAGTSISLEKGYINSEKLDSRVTASALFDNGATYKTVAAANIRMIGMDELLRDLSAPGANNNGNAATMLILRTLQSLGTEGELIGGRSNREYSLRVEANGKITLNGQSFTNLISTFMGELGPTDGTAAPR